VAEIKVLVARAAGTPALEANSPLHRRVPARDECGHPLGDFMVLVPRLRERPAHDLADALARLQAVLVSFTEVVFVDLNVPLNLLWVSVRPRPGVILELFAAMKLVLPEARLVGHQRE
jgi:hypothetical protein